MTNDPRHGMFLLQGDTLVGLDETPYDSEDLLQRHLADHPDLLAGHQIDPVTPRRWLLVDRELAIPDAPEASGRWSLDHLFLDQQAMGRVSAAGRRHRCPACASWDVARIVHGEPPMSATWEERLASGERAIGGCVIFEDQPDRSCNECGHEYRVARTRTHGGDDEG